MNPQDYKDALIRKATGILIMDCMRLEKDMRLTKEEAAEVMLEAAKELATRISSSKEKDES